MKPTVVLIGLPLLGVLCLLSCSPGPALPKGRAYIYGVANYFDPDVNDLDFTDDDAVAMAALFETAGYTVHLRIDTGDGGSVGPATIAQLEEDINTFITGALPEELFIFYFAGHGVGSGKYEDEGNPQEEWLIFYDYNYELPLDKDNGAMKDDDLAVMLKDIPGSMKLVILDSCHSGGFIGDSPFRDPVPADSSGTAAPFSDIFTETLGVYREFSEAGAADIASGNAWVLAAAGEVEESAEDDPPGHGFFTYAFLQAAEDGDLNRDGYITLAEAYRYIADNWTYPLFHPHLTGSALDLVLFRIQQ